MRMMHLVFWTLLGLWTKTWAIPVITTISGQWSQKRSILHSENHPIRREMSVQMTQTKSILPAKLVANIGTYTKRMQPITTTRTNPLQIGTKNLNNTLPEQNARIRDWITENPSKRIKLIISVASAAMGITIMWCLSAMIGKIINQIRKTWKTRQIQNRRNIGDFSDRIFTAELMQMNSATNKITPK